MQNAGPTPEPLLLCSPYISPAACAALNCGSGLPKSQGLPMALVHSVSSRPWLQISKCTGSMAACVLCSGLQEPAHSNSPMERGGPSLNLGRLWDHCDLQDSWREALPGPCLKRMAASPSWTLEYLLWERRCHVRSLITLKPPSFQEAWGSWVERLYGVSQPPGQMWA